MWLTRKKVTRTVIVIKQSETIYIVKSSFFKNKWGRQTDRNCPESKHDTLIRQVGRTFISAPADIAVSNPLQCADKPFIESDVKCTGEPKAFDVSVYIIHADPQHVIKVDDHCVQLSEDPLDGVIRGRVLASRIQKGKQAA